MKIRAKSTRNGWIPGMRRNHRSISDATILAEAVARQARVKLRALDDTRVWHAQRHFARRAEGEGDCDGAETDAERADIEPEITAVDVIEPAAGPRADRHAQG